jgi:hypothetical protein
MRLWINPHDAGSEVQGFCVQGCLQKSGFWLLVSGSWQRFAVHVLFWPAARNEKLAAKNLEP